MSALETMSTAPAKSVIHAVRREDTAGGALDPAYVRRALGHYTTGVTVVTTLGAGGAPIGLTANSFTSVSMDPPLVLWCLASKSPNLQAFRRAGAFAVNVLHTEQRELCRRFSDPRIPARFAGVAWRSGKLGVPVLDGCLATFECRAWSEHEAGDHVVFIGRLTHIEHLEGEPLVFSQGRLGQFRH